MFALLGFGAGRQLEDRRALAGRASGLLLVLVALMGGIVVGVRIVVRREHAVRSWGARFIERPAVSRARERYRRQIAFVLRRFDPAPAAGLQLTVGLAAVAVTGWAFGAVIEDVLAGNELVTFDGPVLAWFAGHKSRAVTHVMRGLSEGTEPTKLFVAAAILGLVIWWAHKRMSLVAVVAASCVGAIVLE